MLKFQSACLTSTKCIRLQNGRSSKILHNQCMSAPTPTDFVHTSIYMLYLCLPHSLTVSAFLCLCLSLSLSYGGWWAVALQPLVSYSCYYRYMYNTCFVCLFVFYITQLPSYVIEFSVKQPNGITSSGLVHSIGLLVSMEWLLVSKEHRQTTGYITVCYYFALTTSALFKTTTRACSTRQPQVHVWG